MSRNCSERSKTVDLGLSDEARNLLRSFALLDNAAVPELLVKHLDSRLVSDKGAYRKYVVEELVNRTSLLDREESEHGGLFHMHRLVREFVIADAKSEDEKYRAAVLYAVCGMRKYFQAVRQFCG